MRRPRPSAMDALLPQTSWSFASDLLFAFADQATQQPADVVLLCGLRLDPIADLLLLLAHMGDQGLDALGQARHRRRALALILRIDGDGLACGFLHDGRRLGLDMAGQKILKLSVERFCACPACKSRKPRISEPARPNNEEVNPRLIPAMGAERPFLRSLNIVVVSERPRDPAPALSIVAIGASRMGARTRESAFEPTSELTHPISRNSRNT